MCVCLWRRTNIYFIFNNFLFLTLFFGPFFPRYFTPKFYQGCCCCPTRILEEGDCVIFHDNEGEEDAPIWAEVIRLHHDKTIDVVLDNDVEIYRASRSSVKKILSRRYVLMDMFVFTVLYLSFLCCFSRR